MTRCGFKTDIKYHDENTGEYVTYVCSEPEEADGLCIFHNTRYLKDPKTKKDHEQKVITRLTEKVNDAEPLICIGYCLPNISFEHKHFDKPVNFSQAIFMGLTNFSGAQFTREAIFYKAQFMGKANFHGAKFTKNVSFFEAQFTREANFLRAKFAIAGFYKAQFMEKADFHGAQFTESAYFHGAQFTAFVRFSDAVMRIVSFNKVQFVKEVDFSDVKFMGRAKFHKAQFNDQHTVFHVIDLSKVSFLDTDITRVRFGEDTIWGDKFKIREEREIENQLQTKNIATDIQLGDVLAVYRNLRENYEFRMRYDEAGEFFVREMEMKRSYQMLSSRSKKNILRLKWWIKEIGSVEKNTIGLGQNDWFSRNISLTGLYYHLSKYGQSFTRPTLFGVGIVIFSTLLWLTQPNPAADFSFQNLTVPALNTVPELNKTTLELAFERSLTNFLPSLSFGTELNVGLLDVAFKIVGGALTFGLIIIALRRKFERKFRH